MTESNDSQQCMDLKTPRNVYLTAFYKRSFAHHTIKNRLPVIITSTIDSLTRSKAEIGKEHGQEGQEDLKHVIGELSKLKYEIQTNKPLRPIISTASDVQFYNDYLFSQENKEGSVRYFSTIWLLAECYMYRRIRESFELTLRLKNYDPFLKQKEESFFAALPIISKLAESLLGTLEESHEAKKNEFIFYLKLNLWGNKCDLSLSNGVVSSETDHLFNLDALQPYILCDHSSQVWKAATHVKDTSNIIDIVFDNAGYELFTDLCLADYITSTKLADTVRFYVKTIPWFISDVMHYDFHWILNILKNSSNVALKKLGEKWYNYVCTKKWILIEHDFWTLPVDFSCMSTVDSVLYKKIAESKLVIFKGDLNYRKLFGEKNWDPVTSVEEALQGFHPTKMCSVRTIKADIVCGLAKGVAEKIEAVNEKWMEVGEYGLIQFSDKVVQIS